MRDKYRKLHYKIYLKFEEIIGNQILLFKVVSKLSPMHKYLIENYFFTGQLYILHENYITYSAHFLSDI